MFLRKTYIRFSVYLKSPEWDFVYHAQRISYNFRLLQVRLLYAGRQIGQMLKLLHNNHA